MQDKQQHRSINSHIYSLIIFVMMLSVVIYGCATMALSMPNAEQLSAAGANITNDDYSMLNRGRAIAMTACSECHKQYFPQEYSPEAWPGLAKEMGKLSSLTKTQIHDLTRYMVTASQMPPAE